MNVCSYSNLILSSDSSPHLLHDRVEVPMLGRAAEVVVPVRATR